MSETTATLYRPVGQKELDLIRASGSRAFPPRLSFQPIFYPVLTEAYAVQIARDWNTKDAASSIETVGSSDHQEYWIPAEDLPTLNANIVGLIEVIGEYRPVAL